MIFATSDDTRNFSRAIVMQFSEIIALPSRGKIATRLQGELAILDRKLKEYSGFSTFQKMLHCQRKTGCTQKFVRATAMQ